MDSVTKIRDLTIEAEYRAILCLDGSIPSEDFFKAIKLPIIAADGAANQLDAIGITPDIIIGDCDSVSNELMKRIPYKKIADQNSSDFQKAISYMKQNDLLPAIICGISGGFLDHIINNVGIFSQTAENIFVDEEVIGFNLNNSHRLKFPKNTKLSIIGMPKCKITTAGLKWELKDFELSFPEIGSYFNRTIAENITIEIKEGKALLIAYMNEVLDAGA